MIPAAIERNYPKRLLTAGWWHMSLFQQPAKRISRTDASRKPLKKYSHGVYMKMRGDPMQELSS